MSNKSNGFSGDVLAWLRGLCMGCADIVPGVSGGTVALILGHYHRLLAGISHMDSHMLGLLRKRKISEAVEYTDFRFLVAIAIGMLSGIVALASAMNYLLENQLSYTFAVFSGLILASSVLVSRRVERWRLSLLFWSLAGVVFAWRLSVQEPLGTELTPLTAFLSAMVAICAMILPGISGAFVLLLLGVYHPVTELIKGLPRGEITLSGLLTIAAFLAGCMVGLLAFSRVLKHLLEKYHDRTLAVLVGLMLGSLYKIWPFQSATPETAALRFKEKVFVHHWPDATLPAVLVLVVVAVVLTFALERVGSGLADRQGD